MFNIFQHRWRVGRSLGRTIYCMVGDEDSEEDFLLGLVDDHEIAEHICMVHNEWLAQANSS